MDFLYAAELKKRFDCFGHFYELGLANGEQAKCRSVLEIVDASVPRTDLSAISLLEPDAVVVMMNPGSSHPTVAGHQDERIVYPRPGAPCRKPLVPTRPDNTQYQVMRIAVAQGWSHIRVLNLSDLRDPKSGSFLQKVEALDAVPGGHAHSIFCPERANECRHALKRRRATPILLGWGQDAGLLPLARQCLDRLGAEPTCTVRSDVHPLLNAHPSPMLQTKKIQWLDGMLAALEAFHTL